jgi:hypothetical protein
MAIIVNFKLQYSQVYFKSILSMDNLNLIPTWQLTNYMHDNLNMHIVYGAKCNIHIMTLIHTIYGSLKCNTCMIIYKCTLYVGAKCNTHIMNLIHNIFGSPKCNTYVTF